MRQGIRGNQQPESETDFGILRREGLTRYTACIVCKQPFGANVRTRNGWLETQISGFCEDCWDEMFREREE